MLGGGRSHGAARFQGVRGGISQIVVLRGLQPDCLRNELLYLNLGQVTSSTPKPIPHSPTSRNTPKAVLLILCSLFICHSSVCIFLQFNKVPSLDDKFDT
ncbi:hypothetical protein AVEN_263976-1 [Araneus ventricosus]|uniref:Uncharacterized protein n=1 Tax=Araneus ventricosus TaxID=182803 RepID=A0A4Y2P6T9_ARAVE|nr:hypothetical protein AVEN_263976-1 [Araneus ventricosus]